jgi:hypothetical protein
VNFDAPHTRRVGNAKIVNVPIDRISVQKIADSRRVIYQRLDRVRHVLPKLIAKMPMS